MPLILKRLRVQADLDEICGRIAEDSEERADSFIDAHAKLHTTTQSPSLVRHRDELADGSRSFPVGRYVFFIYP